LLALFCLLGLSLLASGVLRIDSEWPALLAGAILLGLMWAGISLR